MQVADKPCEWDGSVEVLPPDGPREAIEVAQECLANVLASIISRILNEDQQNPYSQ